MLRTRQAKDMDWENNMSEDARVGRNMASNSWGDQEFLEVVQMLSYNFPNLLIGYGVQKGISLILFKYSYTSKYLHIHFLLLKKWNRNILSTPFCTFPFSLSSTFWRVSHISTYNSTSFFKHGVLYFIVCIKINLTISSVLRNVDCFQSCFITNNTEVSIL